MKFIAHQVRQFISAALTGAAIACACSGAVAQTPTNAQAERDAATQAVRSAKLAGPQEIALKDQAVLKLPKGYVFVPSAAAAQLLRSMGNRPGDSLLGMVLPEGEGEWLVVMNFAKEGYIKDDDAKDWNAEELLKSLKEGTESGNAERTKRGIPAIEVAGWAQKPSYDAGTHRLVWSALIQDKGSVSTGDLGVNLNTYALGREGFITLNLVTSAKELNEHRPFGLELLAALNFNDGKKYTDFNESTDKVAAYGLAALVAGAAAKKLGILALVFAFLAKFAKLAIVAVGAALWGAAKMFKRKPEVQDDFPATRMEDYAASPGKPTSRYDKPAEPAAAAPKDLPPLEFYEATRPTPLGADAPPPTAPVQPDAVSSASAAGQSRM